MSSSKKLSSKEREILNRQRALAAARRQNTATASQSASSSSSSSKNVSTVGAVASFASNTSSSNNKPSNRHRPSGGGQSLRPKMNTISQLLSPSTGTSSTINSNSNSNSSHSNSNRYTASISQQRNSSLTSDRVVNPYSNVIRSNNNNTKKRKLIPNYSSSQDVIDLTGEDQPPPHKKPPPPPPPTPPTSTSSAPATKRPAVRKNIRPSMHTINSSNVQKAISASRSRINQQQQQQQNNTTSNNDTNTSNKKSGLLSLLNKAGITSKQLSQTSNKKISSSSTSYVDSLYKRRRNNKNGGSILFDYDDINDDDNALNMDLYFDYILQWNFLNDLNQERIGMGAHGINSNKNKKENKNKNTHRQQIIENEKEVDEVKERDPIPDIFTSRKQYQKLWSPLCLDESRAQILSDALSDVSKWNGSNNNKNNNRSINSNNNYRRNNNNSNNNNSNGEISLIPILAIPNIKDIGSNKQSISIIIQKDLNSNFNYNQSNGKSICSFMANDLIVLAKDKSIFIQASRGKLYHNQKNNDYNHIATTTTTSKESKIKGCVGVVEYGRKSIENLPIKVSRKFWLQLTTGKKEEKMILLKLGCNVTNLREYSALCRIGTLPLLPYLLCKKMTKAKDSLDSLSEMLCGGSGDSISANNGGGMSSSSSSALIQNMGGVIELGEGFTKYAQNKFNPSQLGAISAAATEYGQGGFTLVKGPPGTGKTTTLVALLNALHIRQMNKYYDKIKTIVNVHNTKSSCTKRFELEELKKVIPRLLVCAPSNNAIDNVIMKIMEGGFIDGHGSRYNPSIVRIGSGQSVNVKDVSLETTVDGLMSEAEDLARIQVAIAGFKAELTRIQSSIYELRRRQFALQSASPWPLSQGWEIRCDTNFLETGRVYFVNHKEKTTTFECPPPPEPGESHSIYKTMPEFRAATQQLVKLVNKFISLKGKLDRYEILQKVSNTSSQGNKAYETVKQQLETDILDSTHIVLTTLGTAGCRALESSAKFEVVVVDEAAQSVEPATLVALQLGSSHAILVGDPQQLPATIFSVSGRNTKYDRSLFQRLEEAGHEVHLLDTQYRMHPSISEFPRKIFYGGYLKDGPNVTHSEYGNPLKNALLSKFPSFRPFSVFDIDSAEERGGTSLSNSTEAHFALHLYRSLVHHVGHIASQSRVCIITPYSQQAALLRQIFIQGLGHEYQQRIEVNTVDSFQGREANVIIFSCVRAAGSKGIGFLSDVRRMNVALTRAKHFLFVIARCQSIVVNPYWDQLVAQAREDRAVIPVPVSGKNIFPDLTTIQLMKPVLREMIPVSKRKHCSNIEKDNCSDEDGEIIMS